MSAAGIFVRCGLLLLGGIWSLQMGIFIQTTNVYLYRHMYIICFYPYIINNNFLQNFPPFLMLFYPLPSTIFISLPHS